MDQLKSGLCLGIMHFSAVGSRNHFSIKNQKLYQNKYANLNLSSKWTCKPIFSDLAQPEVGAAYVTANTWAIKAEYAILTQILKLSNLFQIFCGPRSRSIFLDSKKTKSFQGFKGGLRSPNVTCLAVFRENQGGQAISGLLYPYFSMETKKILIGKVEEETQMS